MNILCIGDIVGKSGREALKNLLPEIKKEYKVDFVIVNAENAAAGSGLTSRLARGLFEDGCDVLTLGDHVWDQKELEQYLNEADYLIRPANFPDGAPGKGYCIKRLNNGVKVAVINLLGRVFMRHQVTCPFRYMENWLERIKGLADVTVLDMHAEATSEKVAIGHFLDGKVSIVYGTHTHIQTADEKILPRGTAYITDLGMSGPYDSVIGQNKEIIIQRFLTSLPIRFNVAQNDIILHGIVVTVDEKTGKASKIVRVQKRFEPKQALKDDD